MTREHFYEKASDLDGEVTEITKKKHVTLDERPNSRSSTPKMSSSSTAVDIKNRYWKTAFLTFLCNKCFNEPFRSLPSLHRRPPAPLPYRPSSAGPSILHSSMRRLSMSQSQMYDMAKKRYTPPPSMSKSMVNKSSINSLNYGNHFRENRSMISDKVILIFHYKNSTRLKQLAKVYN